MSESVPNERSSEQAAERLVRQGPWLRALARALVRDARAAEDAVQDVYALALERPPRALDDEPRLRAWLSRVLRRVVTARARRERQRERREAEARPPAEAGDPARLVAESELARRLVESVLALPEPDRSVLLLKYFEGRSTAELADTLRVTPAAARQRVARALARLRGRLDHQHGGDRRAWLALVLPLAQRRAPLATTGALGGILMTKAVAAVAATTLVALGVWWLRPPAPRDPLVQGGARLVEPEQVAHLEADAEAGAAGRAGEESAPAREAVPAAVAEEAPASDMYAPLLTGRVVDAATGAPVAGADVLAEWRRVVERSPLAGIARARTRTVEDGSYRVRLPGRPYSSSLARGAHLFEVRADAPGYRRGGSGATPALPGPAETTLDVELEAGDELLVRVVDEAGEPVYGARVYLLGGPSTDRGYEALQVTDERGQCAFPLATVDPGMALFAYETTVGLAWSDPVGSAPDGGDLRVPDLTLRAQGTLEGVVLDARGRPNPYATVRSFPVEAHGIEAPSVDDASYEARPSVRQLLQRPMPRAFPWAEVQCDGEGRFALRVLEPGDYSLAIESARLHGVTGPFATGTRAIELACDEHTVVPLLVEDQRGRPVGGVEVQVLVRAGTRGSSRTATTDRAGRTSLRLERGTLTLVVAVPGSQRIVRTLQVPDEIGELLQIVLEADQPSGLLELRPVFADGSRLTDYEVRVTWPGIRIGEATHFMGTSLSTANAVGERDGGRILELGPGEYYLHIEPPDRDADWFEHRQLVTVTAGESLALAPTVERGGRAVFRLEGEVPGAGGVELRLDALTPASAEDVGLVDADGFPRTRDRRTTIHRLRPGDETPQRSDLLAPGPFLLRVTDEAFEPIEVPFTIEAGGETEVVVPLRPRES